MRELGHIYDHLASLADGQRVTGRSAELKVPGRWKGGRARCEEETVSCPSSPAELFKEGDAILRFPCVIRSVLPETTQVIRALIREV